MMLGDKLAQAIRAFTTTAKRTPFEVLLGLIGASCTSAALLHGGSGAEAVALKVVPMVILGLVLTHMLSVLGQLGALKPAARWGLSGVVVSGLVAYGALGFEVRAAASWWQWSMLTLASVGLFSLTPLLLTRDQSARRALFWSINAAIVARIVMTVVYLGALFLGLTLALSGVEMLLNSYWLLNKAPAHLFVWMFMVVAPTMIAAGLPQLGRDGESVPALARRVIDVLCHALVLPLTVLYMTILYLYNMKILLGGLSEAPKNIMSPLVLAAGGLIIVGMLLAEQLRQSATTARSIFVKIIEWLPALSLPLLPLAIWAVWIRIAQYGWTEFRYLRLVSLVTLALIFIVATVQKVRGKRQPLIGVMSCVAALAMVSAVGPLSAKSVTYRAQLARLKAEFREQKLLSPQGLLLAHTSVRDKHMTRRAELRATALYMCDHFGVKALAALMQEPPAIDRDTRCYTLIDALGINYTSGQDEYIYSPRYSAIAFEEAGQLFLSSALYPDDNAQEVANWTLTLSERESADPSKLNYTLKATQNGRSCQGSLDEFVVYFSSLETSRRQGPLEEVPAPAEHAVALTDERGELCGRYVITQADARRRGEQPWVISRVEGALFVPAR